MYTIVINEMKLAMREAISLSSPRPEQLSKIQTKVIQFEIPVLMFACKLVGCPGVR